MVKKTKLLTRILNNPGNVKFANLVKIVMAFGFEHDRTNGGHHIFCHPHIPELINLQEVKGKAKPYQVKQFIALVERYGLTMKEKA